MGQSVPRAIEYLIQAGATSRQLHAYIIIGHPASGEEQVEASMRYAHGLGIRVMLSEFSPLPGTPDGESCRRWTDLDEPMSHNKTFFTLSLLGETKVNRLKNLAARLNHPHDEFKCYDTVRRSADCPLPLVAEASARYKLRF